MSSFRRPDCLMSLDVLTIAMFVSSLPPPGVEMLYSIDNVLLKKLAEVRFSVNGPVFTASATCSVKFW